VKFLWEQDMAKARTSYRYSRV